MNPKEHTDHVTEDRWQAAQEWEKAHWVKSQRYRARYGKNWIWRLLRTFAVVDRYRGDDWNLWWKRQFDDYRFLPQTVENAIEVGCGPYTNIRHILPLCHPNHLFLSDPLIRTYANFKLNFVADAYRKAFCMLDDHPLEDIPFRDGIFDLVVMINVLDHVRNAALCMENLLRITRPGGWMIVGQDLTNEQDLAVLKEDPGLVGHPIKISHEWFAPYLKEGFEPTINKILDRDAGREPANHYGTLLFAGRRKNSSDGAKTQCAC